MPLSLDLVHRLNLRQIAAEEEEDRKRAADDLIGYYSGNHMPLLWAYLDRLLREGTIRETWKKLASFRNVTSRMVKAVTLIGRDPVTITFGGAEGGAAGSAQAAWNVFHDAVEWPLALHTYFQYAELLRTVLVHPYWDPEAGVMAMRLLTPNLVEVRYREGNRNLRRPNLYSILVDQKNGRYEVWDLANREKWEEDANGERVQPAEPIPEEYGDPFVPIRTGYPVDSFWYEDGQQEVLSVQQRVNYMVTQRMVTLFFGGKFPIVEGAQSADEVGFVLDPSMVTYTGNDGDNKPRQLRWDGPEFAGIIDAIFSSIRDDVDALAECYGVPPGSFRVQESPRSGIAIELENAPARDKMRRDRVIHTPTVRAIVQKVLDVWRVHDPRGAPAGEITIDIPDPKFAQAQEAQQTLDLALIQDGLMRPVEFILTRHPDWDEAKATDYLRKCAAERRLVSAGGTFGVGITPRLSLTQRASSATAGDQGQGV